MAETEKPIKQESLGYNQEEFQEELQRQFEEWAAVYGQLEYSEVAGEEFVWRLLSRAEYKQLMQAEVSPEEKEEAVCQICVFYPQGYDFANCPAGIPSTLAREILQKSGFSFDGNPNPLGKELLEQFRREMAYFENQVDCIIVEAFPHLTIEEVANWTVPKTMYYLSRAEWVLNQLRGIPLIDVSTGNQVQHPALKGGRPLTKGE